MKKKSLKKSLPEKSQDKKDKGSILSKKKREVKEKRKGRKVGREKREKKQQRLLGGKTSEWML